MSYILTPVNPNINQLYSEFHHSIVYIQSKRLNACEY